MIGHGADNRGEGRLRWLPAVLIGLAGCLVVWVWTPYNNFILGNAFISDSYLPVAALFVLLLIVLGVNPLLHALRSAWALRSRELAVVLGLLLVGSVLPGQGLLRLLPYAIANVPVLVSRNKEVAEAYEQMALPPSLFPDVVGFGKDTPVSEAFLTELQPGQALPWGAWLPPLLAWGVFLAASWMMMLGMALIVLPQWRENERLSFPLVAVQQSLIEDPGRGHGLPPLFRSKGFWIAAGAVMVIHVLAGLEKYDPGGVPAVPIEWNLRSVFSDEPWQNFPGYLVKSRIYFVFVGVAFLMPSRIGFSIWFIGLAYGIHRMLVASYNPPHHWRTVADHRSGAMVAVAAVILYLGRSHWATVARAMVRRPRDEVDRRNQRAGWLFSLGTVGMFAWMLWVGVQLPWAVFYTVFALMVVLIATRVVAETGLAFFRVDTGYETAFVKMAPVSWISLPSLWFQAVVCMLFNLTSRVNTTVMATHALSLDDTAGPRRHRRMIWLMLAVLLVGVVVCGAVHLWGTYHHTATIDGTQQPISGWGVGRLQGGAKDLQQWRDGYLRQPPYNQPAHVLFGVGLALALYLACLASPNWPVHPIGLLMVETFYGREATASVFLGWLVKIGLVHYGGARLLRQARPVVMGLIMGEVFAAVIWGIVPAVLVALGKTYLAIKVQPF